MLDSLRKNSEAKYESDQLEKILLKHFKKKNFLGGRIRTNVPQVMVFFFNFSFSFINSSGASGTPATQLQRLRLLRRLFCKNFFLQPFHHHESHQCGCGLFVFYSNRFSWFEMPGSTFCSWFDKSVGSKRQWHDLYPTWDSHGAVQTYFKWRRVGGVCLIVKQDQ